MCDGKMDARKQALHQTPLVMTSLKSYESPSGQPPRKLSSFCTGLLFLLFLIMSELSLRVFLASNQHLHPILGDETNRQILARHVGVDFMSCFIVAALGWNARKLISEMFLPQQTMVKAGFEARLFTYHAASFRIALFFFCYQVKNLYDTIVWNDGPEFIFHHVASMIASWGAMYPGFAHFYVVFFLGLSEISTAVLCVLANFDDEFGVSGLGQAFPLTKVVIGATFVVLFITCRTILWPIATFYFMQDACLALKTTSDSPRFQQAKVWMKLIMCCLTGLSILQIAWLGQIFIIAQQEFKAIGLL